MEIRGRADDGDRARLDQFFDCRGHDAEFFVGKKIEEGEKYVVWKKIVDAEELLRRNWKLMSLHENNISGNTKNSIRLQTSRVNQYDKLSFKKMFMVDKMFTNVPNVDSWLSTSFDTIASYSNSLDKNL